MKNILRLCNLMVILSVLSLAINAQTDSQIVGTIEHIENFKSKYVRPRNVDVWLPADYSKKEKYAVLYMQDGRMLFDAKNGNKEEGTVEWGVDETITALVKENKIRKCIVVAIWNTGEFRHAEYFPQKALPYLPKEKETDVVNNLLKGKPESDNYLLFITKELKPFIDKKYSTYKDPPNTFLMGSSMGALLSLYAISEYPNVFGGAACLSTHFIGGVDLKDNLIPTAFNEYFKKNLPPPKNHKLYFDYGNKGFEFFYKSFQTAIDEIIKEKGYTGENWMTKEFVGESHTVKSWAKRLSVPLEFLLKK
jgi:predicted alpha/beta superfamily hydrolase